MSESTLRIVKLILSPWDCMWICNWVCIFTDIKPRFFWQLHIFVKTKGTNRKYIFSDALQQRKINKELLQVLLVAAGSWSHDRRASFCYFMLQKQDTLQTDKSSPLSFLLLLLPPVTCTQTYAREINVFFFAFRQYSPFTYFFGSDFLIARNTTLKYMIVLIIY